MACVWSGEELSLNIVQIKIKLVDKRWQIMKSGILWDAGSA